jgi:hypothetical protein
MKQENEHQVGMKLNEVKLKFYEALAISSQICDSGVKDFE